eukprot:1323227-Pyramimonas_sp.AAC.1
MPIDDIISALCMSRVSLHAGACARTSQSNARNMVVARTTHSRVLPYIASDRAEGRSYLFGLCAMRGVYACIEQPLNSM